jgi:hypothetical protein
MSRKSSLGLAAALGLTTLVATALGQAGLDQQTSKSARDPLTADGRPSADLAPNGFRFSGQTRPASPFMVPDRQEGAPEEGRLATEADRLARQLGQAKSEDDKEQLKAKLADVLDKQFEQRQRRHESEIEALEAQLKKLKDLVRIRNERRREIVAKRLEQVLRDAEGLGW